MNLQSDLVPPTLVDADQLSWWNHQSLVEESPLLLDGQHHIGDSVVFSEPESDNIILF